MVELPNVAKNHGIDPIRFTTGSIDAAKKNPKIVGRTKIIMIKKKKSVETGVSHIPHILD